MFRKLIFYWLPPLLLMAIIFFLSSRQGIAVTHTFLYDFIIFKTLHMLEYGLLTLLFARALHKTSNLPKKDVILLAGMLALLYGMFDELHQTYVPTRSGAIRDVFIDGIGITGMCYLLKQKYHLLKNSI
jgi:VanZ family protein